MIQIEHTKRSAVSVFVNALNTAVTTKQEVCVYIDARHHLYYSRAGKLKPEDNLIYIIYGGTHHLLQHDHYNADSNTMTSAGIEYAYDYFYNLLKQGLPTPHGLLKFDFLPEN